MREREERAVRGGKKENDVASIPDEIGWARKWLLYLEMAFLQLYSLQ
jgi:hypothetical protein